MQPRGAEMSTKGSGQGSREASIALRAQTAGAVARCGGSRSPKLLARPRPRPKHRTAFAIRL